MTRTPTTHMLGSGAAEAVAAVQVASRSPEGSPDPPGSLVVVRPRLCRAVVHRSGSDRFLTGPTSGNAACMPRTLRWDPPRTPFMLQHVRALGVTPRVLEHAVHTGRLTRITRGVYVDTKAVPEAERERHVQRALALQLRRPSAVASHGTAALAWNLPLFDSDRAALDRVSFTESPRRGLRSSRDKESVVRVRRLPAEDRARHPSGLVLTTPARTAVDVAASSDLPEALIVLDAAARMSLQERVGSAWLRDAYQVDAHMRASIRPLHQAAARAALRRNRDRLDGALQWADPRRESPAESLSFGYMVLAELPLPELQAKFTDDLGDMFTDFFWPSLKLVGEVDGLVKYRSAEDLIAERRREARLRAMGLRFVRWEGVEIQRSPAQVMRRLAASLQC